MKNRLNEQQQLPIYLNERQILRIFADICNAVSACHFRRPQAILHRDIKLENILLDSQHNSILCDFGSAILLSSSTTIPNQFQQYPSNQLTTQLIQQLEEDIQRYTTLAYRAPEMIDLYSRLPITLKVDIWAMGCLLYRLMYKKLPFGDSILAIQNGTFVIPDDMANVYSSELNLLVRYLLEIDIDKRPDIWQVSYLTYKLLGNDCPIPNRCQSKIPDLKNLSMPLTESEYRHQRTAALSKTKSTSTNLIDDSSSHGTAVNPRQRPRGMIATSTSLINFNQPSQQRSTVLPGPPPSATAVAPQPPSSSSVNSSRSGSSAQLMFDDDFSQMSSSHAISLTNIPTGSTTTTKTDQIPIRARPSPPTSLSAASGLAFQQQLFPPPLPPPSSNVHSHRRSASQTMPTTEKPSSFLNASSADTSIHLKEISYEQSHHVSLHPRLIHLNRNDLFLQAKGSIVHHPMTGEAKSVLSSSIDHFSTADSDETSDDEQRINPFLHAPFHHSPAATKQQTFDANSIVSGKRTSAFVPYQKQEIPPSNPDVFTNAPFKNKSKPKQHQDSNKSMLSNHHTISYNQSTIDEFF